MRPGDAVELTDGLSLSIKPDIFLDFDPGMPGIVVSKVNTNGFCAVQFNICEKVYVTTHVHKKQFTKRAKP